MIKTRAVPGLFVEHDHGQWDEATMGRNPEVCCRLCAWSEYQSGEDVHPAYSGPPTSCDICGRPVEEGAELLPADSEAIERERERARLAISRSRRVRHVR